MYDQSFKWHQIAYRKHVNDPRMGFNYVVLLLAQDRKNEAIPVLEDLINKFPGYSPPYPQLAKIYFENNNHESLYNLLIKMEDAYNNNKAQFELRIPKAQIDELLNLLQQLRSANVVGP